VRSFNVSHRTSRSSKLRPDQISFSPCGLPSQALSFKKVSLVAREQKLTKVEHGSYMAATEVRR
jgi:hypothetical protein